jgi:S-DNA-T family DNA segregation ATPase FtsK/SpoIIIE
MSRKRRDTENGPGSNVVRLPNRQPARQAGGAGASAGDVVRGEVVTTRQHVAVQLRKTQRRYAGYRHTVYAVGRVTRTAATHQRTRTAWQHMTYPFKGVAVVAKRWRDSHGAGRYERMMRAAEAAGDHEALLEWEARDVAEKERRHRRVMDWVKSPIDLVKAFGVLVLVLAGLLLVVGIILAIRTEDAHKVLAPIEGVLDAIAFTWWVITAYGAFLLVGGTGAAIAYLYGQGRKHAEPPAWTTGTAAAGADTMDELPDEGMILNALKNLNIRGFNQALKEGWRIKFLTPPIRDGKGYRTQLALPPACTVEEIVKRKNVLAHNLVRFPIEVWPTEPQPSVLDLWVAKQGALSGPVDPWPLLEDLDNATCDYFAGVPAGVTIRGDVVKGRLFEANYVVGGVMGSGKSSLVITLLAGAMLDPLVDIDVVVMAENADYDPMRPRLRTLVTGAGEETVDACMGLLRDLFDEIAVRGKALREHDQRFVTKALAEKDDRLRPRVIVIDECQNLFLSEHGEAAMKIAAKVESTARKYAITLMFLTPEPSQDALPRKLISISTNKACFAIGDQIGNDAVLGTGSYKAGISAVGLVPKTDEGPGDVGTCMTRGFLGKPGLMRCFYISQEDMHRVVERAMELREGRQIQPTPVQVREERDPLADIARVLREADKPRMRTQEVLQRLAELNEAEYRPWTHERLKDFLTPFEAAPYKSNGVMMVSAARVAEALADRAEQTAEDTETGFDE